MATINISTDTDYTTIVHADGDTLNLLNGATLTIEQSTTPIGRLYVKGAGDIVITNTSDTTPIFIKLGLPNSTGIFSGEGAGRIFINTLPHVTKKYEEQTYGLIDLGVSDGTANQTFTLPTDANGEHYGTISGVRSFNPYTAKVTVYARADDITDGFFSGELDGTFFEHDEANNQIKFGDGVSGYIPPSGHKIQVANVQIKNTNNAKYSYLDMSPSGSIYARGLSLSEAIFPAFGNSLDVVLKDTSIKGVTDAEYSYGSAFDITNCAYVDLKNVVVSRRNRRAINHASNSRYHVDNVMFVSGTTVGGTYNFTEVGNLDAVMNRLRIFEIGKRNGQNAFRLASDYAKITNLAGFSNCPYGFYFNGNNCTVDNFVFNNAGKRTGMLTTSYGIQINGSGNRYSNFISANFSSDKQINPSSLIVTGAYAKRNLLEDAKFFMGDDSSPRVSGTLFFSKGKKNTYTDIELVGTKTVLLVNGPESSGETFQNILSTTTPVRWQSFPSYGNIENVMGERFATSTGFGTHFKSTLFRTNQTDHSNGLLNMRFTDAYKILVKNGYIAYTNNGNLYISKQGDQLEFESNIHKSITGFTSYSKVYGTYVDIEFQMKTGGKTYDRPYLPMTLANLQAEFVQLQGYIANTTGLQMRFRLTQNTDYFSFIRAVKMGVTIDPTYRVPLIEPSLETDIRDIVEETNRLTKQCCDKMAIVQADLDNHDQYKADVSALALEVNVETHVTNSLNAYDPPTRAEAADDKNEIITEVNANETKIDNIPTSIWNNQAATDLQADVKFIKDIEGGRWKIENNQMVFFEADNITEVARFNLLDANGQPSSTSVFERVRQ